MSGQLSAEDKQRDFCCCYECGHRISILRPIIDKTVKMHQNFLGMSFTYPLGLTVALQKLFVILIFFPVSVWCRLLARNWILLKLWFPSVVLQLRTRRRGEGLFGNTWGALDVSGVSWTDSDVLFPCVQVSEDGHKLSQ